MVGLGHFCYKGAIPLLLSDKIDEFSPRPKMNLYDSKTERASNYFQDALLFLFFMSMQMITRRTLKWNLI